MRARLRVGLTLWLFAVIVFGQTAQSLKCQGAPVQPGTGQQTCISCAYREAAQKYRDAAAKCLNPAAAACYRQHATYYDCEAARLGPNPPRTCPQPSCQPACPDAPARESGNPTQAGPAAGTPDGRTTAPSRPAVIDLTGGGPPVEKRGFEGTRDMAPNGEDAIKDLLQGAESVDKLNLKGADERAAKYGNDKTNAEVSTDESIEKLSMEIDKTADDDVAHLGQYLASNTSEKIGETQSEILNGQPPSDMPLDLYDREGVLPTSNDKYDGWAEKPSLTPEQERQVEESLPDWMRPDPQEHKDETAITPQEGDWRDAFSKLPDKAREIRDSVRNWVNENLDPVRSFTREQVNQLKGRGPSIALDLIDKKKTFTLDPVSEAVSGGIKDAFNTGEKSEPLLGGFMRDEIANRTSKYVANGIRDRAIDLIQNPQSDPSDPVEREGAKVFRAAHPLNLSRGLKPYLENLQTKFLDFWGYIHDSFFPNSNK